MSRYLLTAESETSHLFEGSGSLKVPQQRELQVQDVLKIADMINTWRKDKIPVLEALDRISPISHVVELFLGEVDEASNAYIDLQKFLKKTSLHPNRETVREYRILLEKFTGELVDVIVFLVSMIDNVEQNVNRSAWSHMEEGILSANGQGVAENVFYNLRRIAQNIEGKNIERQAYHLLQMVVSFINHFPHDLDIKAATAKKLWENTRNRDFGEIQFVHENGKPFSEAEIHEVYAYHNLFSKQLRKLFSSLMGREVNPLEEWMKQPFADLYRDIFLFKFSGIEEARLEISKRFILLLQQIETTVDYSQENVRMIFEGNMVIFPAAALAVLRKVVGKGKKGISITLYSAS